MLARTAMLAVTAATAIAVAGTSQLRLTDVPAAPPADPQQADSDVPTPPTVADLGGQIADAAATVAQVGFEPLPAPSAEDLAGFYPDDLADGQGWAHGGSWYAISLDQADPTLRDVSGLHVTGAGDDGQPDFMFEAAMTHTGQPALLAAVRFGTDEVADEQTSVVHEAASEQSPAATDGPVTVFADAVPGPLATVSVGRWLSIVQLPADTDPAAAHQIAMQVAQVLDGSQS